MPRAVDGTLRKFALRVPEVIYQCSGIMVFGKRIKSLVFSTDLSIIKNVNADAIIAVYPFTPQPIITQALLLAADIPVFAGVGGGLTQGQRVVNLAMFAEMQGATGVVLNAPTASAVVSHVAETIDIPVVLTVARADTDFDERIKAGADIFNVSPRRRRLPSCAASASSTPTCQSSPPADRRTRASSRPFGPAPTPSHGRRRPTARSSATSWLPTARTSRTRKAGHSTENRPGHLEMSGPVCVYCGGASAASSTGSNCSTSCTVRNAPESPHVVVRRFSIAVTTGYCSQLCWWV